MDRGSFTPLVFTVGGGMGSNGRAFYSRVTALWKYGIELINLNKKEIGKSEVTSWTRSKVNFALIKSTLLCLRVSWQKLVNEKRWTQTCKYQNWLTKIIV